MPNKHNDKYRHKFEKSTYKVKNWAKYNDALRKRGDITVWFTEEAIEACVNKHLNGATCQHQHGATMA